MPSQELQPDEQVLSPTSPKRCDSCELYHSSDLSQVALDSISVEGNARDELAKASRRQIRWDRIMCGELGLPEGYAKVCVLLIRWTDTDWAEELAQEVNDLKATFCDDYGYTVDILSLNSHCSCKKSRCLCTPQNRLDAHLETFCEAHGKNENNLIIVYHTGHGAMHEVQKHLILHGQRHLGDSTELLQKGAVWNHAEQKLLKIVRCDVLVIMDSCHAGIIGPISNACIVKDGPNDKTYEYFGACEGDKRTPGPGPRSFTRALITSLKDFLAVRERGPFTTYDLDQATAKNRQLAATRTSIAGVSVSSRVPNSVLYSRAGRNDRRIKLEPLKRGEQYFGAENIKAFINLRIETHDADPSEVDMEELAKLISKAVKEARLKTRRVDLLSVEQRKPPTFRKTSKNIQFAMGAFAKKMGLTQEDPKITVPVTGPGVWVTITSISPWQRLRVFTLPFPRPWPLIIFSTFALLATYRALRGPGLIHKVFDTLRKWKI